MDNGIIDPTPNPFSGLDLFCPLASFASTFVLLYIYCFNLFVFKRMKTVSTGLIYSLINNSLLGFVSFDRATLFIGVLT